MKYIIKGILMALVIYLLQNILPNVSVDSFSTAIWVSLLIAIVSVMLFPLAAFLGFLVMIFLKHVFAIIIVTSTVALIEAMMPGFEIMGFGWLLLFSLCVYGMSRLINLFLWPDE